MINKYLNRLFCEDCNSFMDKLPDECIDFIITSPPYDDLRKYNGFVFDFEKTARNIYRIIKKGGAVCWVVNDQVIKGSESGTSFRQALYFMSLGFNLHDTQIYKKLNFMPMARHNRYEQEFEYMFILTKGRPKTFNPIMIRCKYAGVETWGKTKLYHGSDVLTEKPKYVINEQKKHGNIFEYRTGSTLKTKGHPAIFPAKLAADQIRTWSNPLDIVFDPFSGSGTSCEEAKKQARYYIGTDISPEYVNRAEKRLLAEEDIIYLYYGIRTP